MYNQTKWEDRATQYEDLYIETNETGGRIRHTPYEGEISTEGTPQDAMNFNNIETGIQDATIATQILSWWALQDMRRDYAHQALMDSEVLGESKEVTLKNTANFPFNTTVDTPQTVNLTKQRKNLFYTVEAEVKSHVGEVGEINITGKALNGFKVGYTGPGSQVVLTLRVKGGMT